MRQHLDLEKIVVPVVESLGYKFVGLESLPHGGSVVIRIYIDHYKEKGQHREQKIGVEDCQKVSYQANQVLSVEADLQGDYILEVSSPGLDSKLFTVDQCAERLGEVIKLKLTCPIVGRRNFKGVLKAVKAGKLYLDVDDTEELVITFDNIERANVVAQL